MKTHRLRSLHCLCVLSLLTLISTSSFAALITVQPKHKILPQGEASVDMMKLSAPAIEAVKAKPILPMKCPHGVAIGGTCYNCGSRNGNKATAERNPANGKKIAK